MTPPAFITFTGADDHTCVDGMVSLSRRYPIEWGILFAPGRQGSGRYPSMSKVIELSHRARRGALKLSAHLCGQHSKELIRTGSCDIDVFLNGAFARAQVNTVDAKVDPRAIQAWGHKKGVVPILQARGQFPEAREVQWLFDESGGRGLFNDDWPEPLPAGVLHGYSGGLGPENVASVVAKIGGSASSYWLDMEGKLRNESDRFDLARCRAVCEAVYGVSEANHGR